jgi:hypothetical protein
VSFDSSRERLYPHLTLVGGGLRALSKKPKTIKIGPKTPAVTTGQRQIPDAIQKYHALLSYVCIPRFLHWPLTVLVLIAFIFNPIVGGLGYLEAAALWIYNPIAEIHDLHKEVFDKENGLAAIAIRSNEELTTLVPFLLVSIQS